MTKVLLIGDTHPEMISIATELSSKEIPFKIVLPTYFTVKEAKYLFSAGVKFTKLRIWLAKRVLNGVIDKKFLIRKYAYLEFLTWYTKRLGLDSISWKFSQIYKLLLAKKIIKIIHELKPEIVVSYDTIKIPTPDGFKHIVICPMTHPDSVAASLSQSKKLFPNWPEMEDEKPMGLGNTAQLATSIVVLSNFAKATYVAQGFAPQTIEVLHIGPVNGSDYAPRKNAKKQHEKYKVLFLGRMTRIKGIEALMEASHILDCEKFSISLAGQCAPDIESYIVQQSNKKVLTLHANPEPNQIRDFYQNSNIFVLPSFNEGFSIASLEAMSFGLVPILSTNTGVSEILYGTKLNDLIVEPGNTEQIVSKLTKLSNLSQIQFNELQDTSMNISKNYTFGQFAIKFVNQFLRTDLS